MYLINIHAKPTKESDQYDKVMGAYVSVYIDYKDIDGAFELAKIYTQEEGWIIDEVEKDYFTLNSKDDIVDNEEKELYNEAVEFGYALIFNCYETEDEE